MTAVCIISNCRRRAPAGEPFCKLHRDTDGSQKGRDAQQLDGEAATAGARQGIAQTEDQPQ